MPKYVVFYKEVGGLWREFVRVIKFTPQPHWIMVRDDGKGQCNGQIMCILFLIHHPFDYQFIPSEQIILLVINSQEFTFL